MNRTAAQFQDALQSVQARDEQDAMGMAQLGTLTKALGVSRDYRKEAWIAAFNGAISDTAFTAQAIESADKALAAFDKRFPPLF